MKWIVKRGWSTKGQYVKVLQHDFRHDQQTTARLLPDIFSPPPLPVRHHKSQKVMLTRNETSYSIQLAPLPSHLLPGFSLQHA